MNPAQQGGSDTKTGAATTAAPLLVLKGLDKRFGATHALKTVDLIFEAGEIHAIVGENGAGKSTLIKLLTGVYVRSGGEVFWEGKPVALATPHEAIDHGINAVHQEVVLCPHLTVAANLFLGDERVRFGLLQHGAMVREAQKILDDIGFKISAGALLSALTIGQQQLVATARATTRGTRFLIFDEPTAYLTRQEAAQLFALIRRLKAKGVTIVYISHRLEEVFQLADRVTILRDGQLVSTQRVAETNEEKLITGMIARSIEQVHYKETIPFGAEILRTENLTGKGFEDVSIRVRAGEVIGLYGLIGAGRSEFVQSLFGRFPKTGGQIFWNGQPVDHPQGKGCDLARHRARTRKPARSGSLPEPRGRTQHQPAHLQAPDEFHRHQPLRRGGRRRPADQRCADQDRLARRSGVEPLRRQPAEDRRWQMAEPWGPALHLRRTNSWCRRRHESRNLQAFRQTTAGTGQGSS